MADKNLVIDLSRIPEGWWLYGLYHNHTPVLYAGDIHREMTAEKHGLDPWSCKLQHISGGRLTEGNEATPQAAVDAAILDAEAQQFIE